jgi:hypothetical protein
MMRRVAALGLASAMLIACDDPGDTSPPADCYEDPSACIDPTGVHYQFVVDAMWLSATRDEILTHSFDLDGDPGARPDNRLGTMLGSGFELEGGGGLLGERLARGDPIVLLDLQATSWPDSDGAGLRLRFGADAQPPPCNGPDDDVCGRHLAGDAEFAIATDSPANALLAGTITDTFVGGPGRAVFDVAVDGVAPARFELIGARVELVATPTGVRGRIGGGIPDIDGSDLLDSLAVESWRRVIARDCPAPVPATLAPTASSIWSCSIPTATAHSIWRS